MIWYIKLKYAFGRWRRKRHELLKQIEREEQLKSCSDLTQTIVVSLQNSPEDWEFGAYYITWVPSKKSPNGEVAIWIANNAYGIHLKGESVETSSFTKLERSLIFETVIRTQCRKRRDQLFRLEP